MNGTRICFATPCPYPPSPVDSLLAHFGLCQRVFWYALAVSCIPEQVGGSSITEYLRLGPNNSIGLVSSYKMASPTLTQFFPDVSGESTRCIRIPRISRTKRYPFKDNLHSFSFLKLKKYIVTFSKEIFFYRNSTFPLPIKQRHYSQHMYTSLPCLLATYLDKIYKRKKCESRENWKTRASGSITVSPQGCLQKCV